MSDTMLLNVLLFLPLGAAALLAFVRGNANAVRITTTAAMAVQFVIAMVLFSHFDGAVPGLQAATSVPWIAEWGVSYAIGLDGVNILLVLLTAFLGPLVILGAAWLLPVEPELKQVLVVQAAMPVAIFPIVLARLHGGDPLTAVRIVVGSSLLGLLTIPLWLKLGLRLVAH